MIQVTVFPRLVTRLLTKSNIIKLHLKVAGENKTIHFRRISVGLGKS